MPAIATFVRRRPQATFWVIAYAISAGGYTLSRLYPSDAWVLVLWGIALAGALITWTADGAAGLRTYLGRIVRWRAGARWYAVALLTPFALQLVAAGLTLLSGSDVAVNVAWPDAGSVLAVFVFSVFTIALGEEPGFRGFALPRLLVGRSAITASLILGMLHALWHLPLVVGGDERPTILVNVAAAAVLFTWLYHHTAGSVLIAILLHASSDASAAVFGPLFADADAAIAGVWLAVAYVALALVVRGVAGAELGRAAYEPGAQESGA